MGSIPQVGFDVFPKQGDILGKYVKVCFHYDFTRHIIGQVIRDDMEPPYVTIIQLVGGQVVLGTECQWSPNA